MRELVAVDEETGEEEAAGRKWNQLDCLTSGVVVKRSALEEHDQTSDEVGDSSVLDEDAKEEHDARRREVEQNQHEDELPERRNLGDQSDRGVNDGTKDEGGNDSEGDDVEEELGRKVGEGVVVPVCALSGEEETL